MLFRSFFHLQFKFKFLTLILNCLLFRDTYTYMVDRYTAMRTPIQAGEIKNIEFVINADPLSRAANRFYVVFRMNNKGQKDTSQPLLTRTTSVTKSDSQKLDVFPNPVGPDRTIHFNAPTACENFTFDIQDDKIGRAHV